MSTPTCQLSDPVTEVKNLSIYNPNTDQVCVGINEKTASSWFTAEGWDFSCKQMSKDGMTARVCATCLWEHSG